MTNQEHIRKRLIQHLSKTRARNPSYSLRSMAKSFGTSPAQLSQVLSKKRPLSQRFIRKIAQKMGSDFIQPTPHFDTIAEDRFKVISDWYHFAILSLSKVSDCQADPRWISERLGIDFYTAKEGFDRLHTMGLIEVSDGKYRQTGRPLHTTNDVPSAAIQSHHLQNLKLAAEKLQSESVSKREFSSITVATSLQNIPEAKERIRKFKQEMFSLLEADKKTEVYTLAIQLFPVTNPQGEDV